MSIIIILITDASRIGLSIKEENDQEEQAEEDDKQEYNISTNLHHHHQNRQPLSCTWPQAGGQ
jgi:predicted RNA-binding protein with RPS1 domain